MFGLTVFVLLFVVAAVIVVAILLDCLGLDKLTLVGDTPVSISVLASPLDILDRVILFLDVLPLANVVLLLLLYRLIIIDVMVHYYASITNTSCLSASS